MKGQTEFIRLFECMKETIQMLPVDFTDVIPLSESEIEVAFEYYETEIKPQV